jgi:hypothetical protein
MGVSNEIVSCLILSTLRNLATGRSMRWAISSDVGSRPNSVTNCRDVRNAALIIAARALVAMSTQAISYNSCRNRHCPKCQAQARERWLAARERELLDTSYFHVVFTVPHELNPLALENPTLFYDLLFTASAQTLLEIAADPKHLGAEIGIISTLHTWGQNLLLL